MTMGDEKHINVDPDELLDLTPEQRREKRRKERADRMKRMEDAEAERKKECICSKCKSVACPMKEQGGE
jgi:hypothetical protein